MTSTSAAVVRGQSVSVAGWQSLGMAVLTETFRWAAFGLTGATTAAFHAERIGEAQRFLFHGTALDVALDLFAMDLTGEDARNLFSAWLRRHQGPYKPHSQ